MTLRLRSQLTTAIIRSATSQTKLARAKAASDVADLLRHGAPIGESERIALATLFAGGFRVKRGRPRSFGGLLLRCVFRLDFHDYFEARRTEGIRFDEAIETFAAQHGVAEGTAREWVSTRNK